MILLQKYTARRVQHRHLQLGAVFLLLNVYIDEMEIARCGGSAVAAVWWMAQSSVSVAVNRRSVSSETAACQEARENSRFQTWTLSAGQMT